MPEKVFRVSGATKGGHSVLGEGPITQYVSIYDLLRQQYFVFRCLFAFLVPFKNLSDKKAEMRTILIFAWTQKN